MIRARTLAAALSAALVTLAVGCSQPAHEPALDPEPAHDASGLEVGATDASTPSMTDDAPAGDTPTNDAPARETATFGAGCFWCVEAVLEQIDGVHDVVSGYMGGEIENPTYKQICTGTTGHAEVVQVHFDPNVVTFDDLVELFWDLHDPTTLNRQGADVGTQYRSAIFYHSETQRESAEAGKTTANPRFGGRIVTEITPASTFYEAEDYHQDYYFANREQPYCRAVISPKLKKLGLKY